MLPGIASTGVLAGGGELSLIVANWTDVSGSAANLFTNTPTLTFDGGARTLRLVATDTSWTYRHIIDGGTATIVASGSTFSITRSSHKSRLSALKRARASSRHILTGSSRT